MIAYLNQNIKPSIQILLLILLTAWFCWYNYIMGEEEKLASYIKRTESFNKKIRISLKKDLNKNKFNTLEYLRTEFILNQLDYLQSSLWFGRTNLEGTLDQKNAHLLIPHIRRLLELYIQIIFILKERSLNKTAQFLIELKKGVLLIAYLKELPDFDPPDEIERLVNIQYKDLITTHNLKTETIIGVDNWDQYQYWSTKLFRFKKQLKKKIFHEDTDNLTEYFVMLSDYEHCRPGALYIYSNIRKRVYYAYLITFGLWILEEIILSDYFDIHKGIKMSFRTYQDDLSSDNYLKQIYAPRKK